MATLRKTMATLKWIYMIDKGDSNSNKRRPHDDKLISTPTSIPPILRLTTNHEFHKLNKMAFINATCILEIFICKTQIEHTNMKIIYKQTTCHINQPKKSTNNMHVFKLPQKQNTLPISNLFSSNTVWIQTIANFHERKPKVTLFQTISSYKVVGT